MEGKIYIWFGGINIMLLSGAQHSQGLRSIKKVLVALQTKT